MKDLTTKQKKEFAKVLYLRENLTQEEIAERVNVTRQTVNRWIGKEKWEMLKTSMSMGREQQISHLYSQLAEINALIASREKGKQFATPTESNTISQLTASIKKMETDVGIADIISVGKGFCEYYKKIDPEDAKKFVRLFDMYIKEKLR